jgi:NAD(P)-dependent dehydrogenase (short-subunit alcohol dehydrogenase family)
VSLARDEEALMLLADKVAVVSGIGPGLGRELALALARHGASLVLAARSEGALAELAKEVAPLAGGRRVETLPCDVTRPEDCARLASRVRDAFGHADVLVNNAYHPGTYVPIEADDLEGWRAPFEVNVLGSLRLTKALLPLLAPRRGSVVMVNSMIVRRPLPTMGGYAASKAALLAATQTLAREVGGSGVRVNSVVPGYIFGPALEGYFAAQAKQRGVDARVPYDEVAREIALGRIPTSAEVADAVLFFASDLSRAVTGASLDVNGGHVFH